MRAHTHTHTHSNTHTRMDLLAVNQMVIIHSFFHSFLRHMQNVTIPCRSQQLLPSLSVMYFSLPQFSTNYSSILSHLILPSISWSASQSCCPKIHIQYHSFHRHVHNVTIPCRSQQLLPSLSVMYFFLPPFSTNYPSILSHLILPSISWSTSQSCCSQIHILTLLAIPFPSILCTCPNQRNIFNLIVSIIVLFLTLA